MQCLVLLLVNIFNMNISTIVFVVDPSAVSNETAVAWGWIFIAVVITMLCLIPACTVGDKVKRKYQSVAFFTTWFVTTAIVLFIVHKIL